MRSTLVPLLVRARARSMLRSTAAIAAAEPGWFLFVTLALVGGGVAAALRLAPERQRVLLGAAAVLLTIALMATRRDTRLHHVLGVSPELVRVVEALLWAAPLLVLAALRSLRDGALLTTLVAATAYASPGVPQGRRARRPWRLLPRMVASLPEWTVGVARAAPLLVPLLVAGLVGSASAGIVILIMAVVSLVTSAFFWTPAEGWLLIHARGQTAARLVRGTMLRSVAMLAALLAPLVLLGTWRAPSSGWAYLLACVLCLHAHAAAVAVKYASYREGHAPDAAASLVWAITTLAIVVPPAGLLLLVWLVRRGVTRIARYCVVVDHAR